MKQIYVLVTVLLLLFVFVVGCARIGPGYVGIKVNMAGNDKGVEEYPALTGWVFYNPFTTTILEYPTFIHTVQWTIDVNECSPINEEISFNSKDGMVINADISLSYCIYPEKIPHFYVKFRTDDISTFTHGFLRNVARDKFNEIGSKYAVEEVYGPKKEVFLSEVRCALQVEIYKYGVQLEQFGFIGAPRPPQNVIDSINSKIAAIQKAMQVENEVREAQAEAKKTIVKADGEARANQVLTNSLTENLIKWKNLEITKQAIEKWDGKRPMVEGSSSGLLITIPIQK